MGNAKNLYVTVDGVLQPLAYSQVCRVLIGLTQRGLRYRLLSLEKPRDLADAQRVRHLHDELAGHGIEWTFHAYAEGGKAANAAWNMLQLGRKVSQILAHGDTSLIHARAYHPALLAAPAGRWHRVPYLFDARGRWVDERLAGGRWFKNPRVEAVARRIESQLYRRAAGLVVLTQLHADDIIAGQFGPYRGAPIRVITTCADFEEFQLASRLAGRADSSAIPSELASRLGRFVIAFIGSTNASYRYRESFELAREILRRRSDAHLLILTPQVAEFRQMAEACNISPERITITTARHRDMASWLSRIDWAIQILNSGPAKRGSMPTKLGEFFAAGVRPLHFGCNSEVTGWVERAGSGYVLKSLESSALAEAAEFVASSPTPPQLLETARAIAQPHFDLRNGVEAYRGLITSMSRQALDAS